MRKMVFVSSIAFTLSLTASASMAQRAGGPARYGQPDLSAGTAKFDAGPLAKDDAEKKILDALAEMAKQRTADTANVPPGDGRILRLLTESLGAKHVVELGTSNGYSGVWFCLALRQTNGKLTTFEIDAGRAAEARRNFEKAGVANLVTLVEGDAHDNLSGCAGTRGWLGLSLRSPSEVDHGLAVLLGLRRLSPSHPDVPALQIPIGSS